MQAIRVPPSRHQAAGELIDNHYFAVLYDILDVFLEKSIGTQQLADGMDLFGTLGMYPIKFVDFFGFFLGRQRAITFDFGHRFSDIGNFKKFLLRFGKLSPPVIGQIDCIFFFTDDIVQGFIDKVRLFIPEIIGFHSVNQAYYSRFL